MTISMPIQNAAGAVEPGPEEPGGTADTRAVSAGRAQRKINSGQAMLMVALAMSVFILFVGLGVDVGNLMGKKAKLQSAVDTAALSGAQILYTNSSVTQTATNIVYQILEANGVTSNTLVSRGVDFPGTYQIHVHAVESVDTFFMRLIPLWRTVQIAAEATADLNSYAEITTKPYGTAGVVNELNLMVWGADSWRRGGDAFSPRQGVNGGLGANPEYVRQPYGYLYRIDVPAAYPYSKLDVQLFDPDSYNQTGAPPAWPTPVNGSPTPTPSANQYASCSNPRPDPPPLPANNCTSNGTSDNTGIKLNAFSNGRPALWRVDEIRTPYTMAFVGNYNSAYATTTQYTLWHFSPHISTAFGDPALLSDQTNGAYLARYSIGWDATTDLSWYRPDGFQITLYDASGNDLYERELNGGMYFYLYVQGISGSSENNFDIRVGPPDLNSSQLCHNSPCGVNQLYLNNINNPSSYPDWQDGGALIFAKQTLPLNLDTGASFPLMFTQVSKNAAGQVLGVRHFDQDCNGGCGSQMQYQMQVCGCANLQDPTCWANIGVGYVGDNDSWVAPADASHPSGYPDPEPVTIPSEGSALYNTFFGNNGQCSTSWLRIQSNPSYSQDSTTWQMPYIRPRLIK